MYGMSSSIGVPISQVTSSRWRIGAKHSGGAVISSASLKPGLNPILLHTRAVAARAIYAPIV